MMEVDFQVLDGEAWQALPTVAPPHALRAPATGQHGGKMRVFGEPATTPFMKAAVTLAEKRVDPALVVKLKQYEAATGPSLFASPTRPRAPPQCLLVDFVEPSSYPS